MGSAEAESREEAPTRERGRPARILVPANSPQCTAAPPQWTPSPHFRGIFVVSGLEYNIFSFLKTCYLRIAAEGLF